MLTLGSNLGTNTVKVSAGGIGQVVIFNAVAVPPLDIPDPNLRAAVENALNKSPGEPIAPEEMATLDWLTAYDANISDLTGLEHATNLTGLDLGNNTISDITAVAGLTNLESLDLGDNTISDITAVAELTNLNYLFLYRNDLSNISALSGLTNLKGLEVGANQISDISALSGLTNLEWLKLLSNQISDISPLVANPGLGDGDEVDVIGNPLSYQSINTHIPALQSRGVIVCLLYTSPSPRDS